MAIRQGTPEWTAARRELITATDIPVLLGLSPFKAEAELAAEKLGQTEPRAPSLRMRIGLAMEPLIAAEYTAETGRPLRRIRQLVQHPSLVWAAASPDYRAVGEKLIVEIKWIGNRARFADGLPQDIEAQVQWQLGILGWPAADVAALVVDDLLPPFRVERDAAMFGQLVDIALDFRRRLLAGGPFAESLASLKARYPADDGSELAADADLIEAVRALVAYRERRRRLEEDEEHLETAIKARMGEHAFLTGPGFRVSWKRTRDTIVVNWQAIADGLLRTLPETERTALVGLQSTVRPGFRPFRVTLDKED